MGAAVQLGADEPAALERHPPGPDIDQRRVGEVAVDEGDVLQDLPGQVDVGEILFRVGTLGQLKASWLSGRSAGCR